MNISVLKGKILSDIQVNDDSILFTTSDGDEYVMNHIQDCCENVYIESIVGSMSSLIGSEIFVAEEVTNSDIAPLREDEESYTWTFYKIDTAKGGVTIRWYGYSNGYYSECVNFEKIS